MCQSITDILRFFFFFVLTEHDWQDRFYRLSWLQSVLTKFYNAVSSTMYRLVTTRDAK